MGDLYLQRVALRIGKLIGGRLVDFLKEQDGQRTYRADPYSAGLARGSSGLALLFCALWQIERDQRWLHAAHQALQCATKSSREKLGLHTGWLGLAAATHYVNRTTGQFGRLLSTLSAELSSAVIARSHELTRELLEGTVPITAEVDLISGAAGWSLSGCLTAEAQAMIRKLLVTQRWQEGKDPWAMRKDQSSAAETKPGLAHGLAGVIVSLSLDKELGESKATLQAMIEALDGRMQSYETAEILGNMSWCAGRSGVAAALAEALTAVAADHGVNYSTDPAALVSQAAFRATPLVDHGICHGTAGAVLCSLAVARSGRVVQNITPQVSQIICDFDKDLRYGYRFYDPEGDGEKESFLQGGAGTALTLLSIAFSIDRSWTRFLGISLD
jgi:lantibiotic modifying enzyme